MIDKHQVVIFLVECLFGIIIPAMCFYMHHKYDEVLRPMLGTILFKSPVLPLGKDPLGIMAIGNRGKEITTVAQLYRAYDLLQEAIKSKSYFRTRDLRVLAGYQRQAIATLSARIRAERYQEERARWTEEPRKKPKSSTSGWRAVLAVDPAENDLKVVTKKYRALAQKAHPDRGGTHEKITLLNSAIEQARNELG